ncbi:alpha/beta fold hydrolase [Streptomyces sp. NBC_00663]|uniref:alpha/beta hydrolase n=1 Tax=Streptomyces sp. NBC_00663 TaxID=2975801 RepID=UPI002E3114D1|nr:alpha/beta fold hydrolase [Streptomyces sp. NBC_00663]
MERENHVVGDTFVYRYAHPDPDHVLLVQHGIGGHGGVYDPFAAHYAGLGAEVWCMDAPGHGMSRIAKVRPAGRFTLEEWVGAAVEVAEHIDETTGLPVFIKGSSLGAAAAYGAYAASDVFTGAVLMGYAIPSSPMIPADNPFRTNAFEQLITQFGDALLLDIDRFYDLDLDYGYKGARQQKREDPLNTWTYELSSVGSLMRYEPTVPLAENTKPILFTVGEKDPVFTPDIARSVVAATGGPVQLHVHPGGVHQLMIFHTADYSAVVSEWCRKRLTRPAAEAA